jgi:hypothetical protein
MLGELQRRRGLLLGSRLGAMLGALGKIGRFRDGIPQSIHFVSCKCRFLRFPLQLVLVFPTGQLKRIIDSINGISRRGGGLRWVYMFLGAWCVLAARLIDNLLACGLVRRRHARRRVVVAGRCDQPGVVEVGELAETDGGW